MLGIMLIDGVVLIIIFVRYVICIAELLAVSNTLAEFANSNKLLCIKIISRYVM